MSGYKLQYNCIMVTQFSHLCVCVWGGVISGYSAVCFFLLFVLLCLCTNVHKSPATLRALCHFCTAQIKSLCSLFLQTIPLSSVASSSFFH